jgi:hypothetical protein
MTNLTSVIRRRWAIAEASSGEPAATRDDAAPVPRAEGASGDRRNRAARGWAFGLLIALLVQFGLGMYVNLFAHIPLNHPGHRAENFFAGSYHSVAWAETSPHAPLILAFHAGLGLLLVPGSLWLAVLAIRGRRAGFVGCRPGRAVHPRRGVQRRQLPQLQRGRELLRDGAALRRRRPLLHRAPGASPQHRTSSPNGLTQARLDADQLGPRRMGELPHQPPPGLGDP